MASPSRAVALASFLFLPTLTACSGDSTTVVLETRDRFGGSTGKLAFPAETENDYLEARLYLDGDPTKIVNGVWSNGQFRFEGVSGGRNLVETWRPPNANFPNDPPYIYRLETDRRKVDFGQDAWAREPVNRLDPPSEGTELLADVTGLSPWNPFSDSLEFYSGTAEFHWRADWRLFNVAGPDADETAYVGWSFPFAAMGMTRLDYRSGLGRLDPAKDQLTVIQRRRVEDDPTLDGSLAPYDLWYGVGPTEVVTRAFTTAPAIVDAASAHVALDFQPVETAPFTFDLRGDSFVANLADTSAPATTTGWMYLDVFREPGVAAQWFVGATPTIWSIASYESRRPPANPLCYPDAEANCDASCGGVCDDTLLADGPFDHPGNLSVSARLAQLDDTPGELRILAGYVFRTRTMLPGFPTARSLNAYSEVSFRIDPATGSTRIERTVGPPRALAIDGHPAHWVATGDPDEILTIAPGGDVQVSWDAPPGDAPDVYRLYLMEIGSTTGLDGTVRTSRTAGAAYTRGTSTWFASTLFREGYHYYVRVGAVRSDRRPDDVRNQRRDGREEIVESATRFFRL